MELLAILFVLYTIQNLILWHGYLDVGMKPTWKTLGIKNVWTLLSWNFLLGYPLWQWRKEIYKWITQTRSTT